MNNFWRVLFSRLRMNDSPSREDWLNVIETHRNSEWALRLLALAYLESGKDRVCKLDNMMNTPGYDPFRYRSFTQNRERLESQLTLYGVELLHNGNCYQYLRTIQKYSGQMYLRIARRLHDRVHGWDEEHLNKCLDDVKVFFRNPAKQNDARRTEEDDAFDDAIELFQKIGRMYREFNLPPSREDVADLEEARNLTEPVLQKLYDTLFAQTNEEGNRRETVPTLCAGNSGEPVFFLPEIGQFRDEIAKDTNHVVFRFMREDNPDENYALVSYDLKGNQWKMRARLPNLPVKKIGQIWMRWKGRDNNLHKENVTPKSCSQDFILLNAENNEPCSRLRAGKCYRVLPLKVLPIVQFLAFGKEDFETVELDGNCFTPNADIAVVRIGGVDYDLGASVADWLDTSQAVSYVEHQGSRLFFSTDSAIELVDGLTFKYGDKVLDLENPPVWQRQSLEIFFMGQSVLKYPVTFINPVSVNGLSWNEFQETTIPFGEERQLCVSIGNYQKQLTCDKEQLYTTFEHGDFSIKLKLPRRGFYLETPDHIHLPILPRKPHDDSPVPKLAEEDFKMCSYHLVNCGENALFARGNSYGEIKTGKDGTFSNPALSKSFLWETSRHCSILLNRGEPTYCFHIFDPIQEPVPLEEVLPGEEKKTARDYTVVFATPDEKSTDLTVSFFVSACSVKKEKYLVFYPAHRQDEKCIEIKADESRWKVDEKGRILQTLVFKDFYTRTDVDWGKGLLCFIASKTTWANGVQDYKVNTAGFFLNKPSCGTLQIADDPYGLRKAMAERDVTKIQEVMTSEDPEIREYVARFIENMTGVMAPLNAYKYLNSYWNQLKKKDGSQAEDENGYIFLAGWYFANGGGGWDQDRQELTADFAPYWDSLLLPYRYHANQDLTGVTEQILQNLFECSWGFYDKYAEKDILTISQQLEQFGIRKDRADVSHRAMFSQKVAFTYPQLSEMTRKFVKDNKPLPAELNQLLRPLHDLWREYYCQQDSEDKEKLLTDITSAGGRGITQTVRRRHYDAGMVLSYLAANAPYLFYPGYGMSEDLRQWVYSSEIEIDFSQQCLQRLLDAISRELHEWRKDPSLPRAQKLRSALIQLRRIDDSYPYDNEFFPLRLRQYIQIKSLLLYNAEQNNQQGE